MKKAKNAIGRIRSLIHAIKLDQVVSYLIMTFCGLLTVYLFASSYETIFNVDLPIVDAVTTVQLQPFNRVLEGFRLTSQTDVGNFGVPQMLKLPNYGIRMVLAPAIVADQANDNKFLARANTGHYALTSAVNNGDIGNMVIYYRKSWRTDDNPGQMQVGDNLFVDTDRGWRYFFRINSTKIVSGSDTYISQTDATTQLIVVAQDSKTGLLYVSQASLVNVQNVSL
ncbi:MAG TPA: hypothetical protein VNG90_01785 [Candidatus Acidoferrum sp.]|nr:hypothetical protein [Candidatus Acidoferrum sp.]